MSGSTFLTVEDILSHNLSCESPIQQESSVEATQQMQLSKKSVQKTSEPPH